MWRPVHGGQLRVSLLERELGEREGGAKWRNANLGEKREFFMKKETSFARESHGVFERVRERRG